MRLKICGLTKRDQCIAIAQLGVHALGFILVPSSRRYVAPDQLKELIDGLPPFVARVGVFADATVEQVIDIVCYTGLSAIQLHGQESPEYCAQLRAALPNCELIKALRLISPDQLEGLTAYRSVVTALLLDAYHPDQLGGTGHVLPWNLLQDFRPSMPWILAGGLTPENLAQALDLLHPEGIDLSSGVELAPGDKDLGRVGQIQQILYGRSLRSVGN